MFFKLTWKCCLHSGSNYTKLVCACVHLPARVGLGAYVRMWAVYCGDDTLFKDTLCSAKNCKKIIRIYSMGGLVQ